MDNEFPSIKTSNGKASDAAASRHELRRCRRLPAARRSPVWPVILATLIILGMLLAFHQLVKGVVRQSDLRHKAVALHAEATWRCNKLRGRDASGSCPLRINAEARRDAVVQARNIP